MNYFIGHQLIRENGVTIVKLYLDKQLSEFSFDFLGLRNNSKTAEVRLDKAVRHYIKDKLPGIRISAAYIIFGSLLIASIPLISSCSVPSAYPSPPTQAVTSSPPRVNPPDATGPAGGKTKAQSDLILVNKQNPLPSDYVPDHLVVPDVPFSFRGVSEVRQMRQDAASALEQLFKSAKDDNISLVAVSGYRSYTKQAAVFAASAKRHGSEAAANQYSAKPGQSEHQTGLAIDVSSASVSDALSESFGETKEGKWLAENADKFGFIIRYHKETESITGYQYEPWHIRYVGIQAAKEITQQNITLEEYLETS